MTIFTAIVQYVCNNRPPPIPKGTNISILSHSADHQACVGVLWGSDNANLSANQQATAKQVSDAATALGTVQGTHPKASSFRAVFTFADGTTEAKSGA